jgi:hypothetical protein
MTVPVVVKEGGNGVFGRAPNSLAIHQQAVKRRTLGHLEFVMERNEESAGAAAPTDAQNDSCRRRSRGTWRQPNVPGSREAV